MLDTARQRSDEVTAPTRRVEIVKHVGAMLLDLRFENVFHRRTETQASLRCPQLLKFDVVAIGEEGPFGVLIDR